MFVGLAGELLGLLGKVVTQTPEKPRSARCTDQAHPKASVGLGGTGEVLLLQVGLVILNQGRGAPHSGSFSAKSVGERLLTRACCDRTRED